MDINIKLAPGAMTPMKSHDNDAGWDVYAAENVTLRGGCVTMVRTGVMLDIPAGWYGKLETRSGMAKIGIIVVGGIIDSGYHGPVNVLLYYSDTGVYTVLEGNRIAQLLILPVPAVEWVQVEDFAQSDRGENGFWSTGV